MRIVFMGSPQAAVPVLELLVSNQHQVLAVYTPPDREAGRGRNPLPPPVKEAALGLGLQVVQIANFKGPDPIRQLAGFEAEAIVVAAFGALLPAEVLEICPFGCLNIHPSLLPRYRGAAPVAAAILAGDEFAGVSVMRLDAGLDSGPIFSQGQVSISSEDSAGGLTERLFQVGGRMLLEVLAELPQGKLRARSQGSDGVSYAPELKKEAGKIDWSLPAVEIWRRVRAFQPWPGAYASWEGKQIKVLEALPVESRLSAIKGEVVALPPAHPYRAAVGVGTGQGILAILKLQMEGKRPMSGEEFRRGQRDFQGAILS
jgi:methionyl-tRNA formyltransferase